MLVTASFHYTISYQIAVAKNKGIMGKFLAVTFEKVSNRDFIVLFVNSALILES